MLARASAASRAARLLAAVQRGLVGVLFALKDPRRKAVPRASLAVAGLAYDAAQVLAFPLHASLGWSRTASLGWLQTALAFRNPFAAAEATAPAVQAAVVGCVLALLAVLAGCLAYSVHGFATGAFKSVRPLQVLRVAARLAGVLQVTVVERLATVFVCGDAAPGVWLNTTLACGSAAYGALVAAAALLLAVFVAFSLTVATVFFERDYGARGGGGRAHGRVEGLLLAARVALTFIFSGSLVPPAGRLAAVVAAGALYAGAYVRLLPEFAGWRNAAGAAVGAVFLWSALCAAPALLLPDDSPWRPPLGLLWAVGTAGAAAAGVLAVHVRAAAYAARVLSPA